MSTTDVAVGMAALAAGTLLYKRYQQPSLPYPPGPRPDPIIGNFRHLPKEYAWKAWAKVGEEYGPLTYINVLGQPVLIINTHEAAVDLLDKRGKIYSDRPHSTMLVDLVGGTYGVQVHQYGHRFRLQRKYMNGALSARSVQNNYWGLQERETYKYMKRIIERPGNFLEDLKLCQAAIILNITYGNAEDGEHDFIHMGEQNTQIFTSAVGGYMVDWLPILRYIPSWMPGAEFKRQAAIWNKQMRSNVEIPFNMVKRLRASGKAEVSFVSKLLDENDETEGGQEGEEVIRDAAMSIYGAGSDTTQSLIQVFIIAMLLYPEVQRLAREEIDRITNKERLPLLGDKESATYLNAVMTECLRWHQITPMGVAHRLTEDDEYQGYFIPKGTMVYANAWTMSQDTTRYPNPKVFDPTRWIPREGYTPPLDSRAFAFGYGRRVCPGTHLAQPSAWIAMASMLATFNIRKKKDANGMDIEPTIEFLDSLVSVPKPFECDFIPRSERAINLVREAVASHHS